LIHKKFTFLIDFFLPRFCIGCSNKLKESEKIICLTCNSNFEVANENRIQNEFQRKFNNDNLIKDFSSAFVFYDDSEIQKLIHSLKYDQNFLIGKFLGRKTAQILIKNIESWNADLIIPIPLHSLRKADRGFNQASEIAKGISQKIKIPQKSNIVRRHRFTQTQTQLTFSERKNNIEGAFTLRKNKQIIDKTIILVDDVITTGATISECAKLLKENGAKNIYAVSVAIAD